MMQKPFFFCILFEKEKKDYNCGSYVLWNIYSSMPTVKL